MGQGKIKGNADAHTHRPPQKPAGSIVKESSRKYRQIHNPRLFYCFVGDLTRGELEVQGVTLTQKEKTMSDKKMDL
ncbi:MAG: hypothetical protein ACOH2E_06615 [Candidatus Paracaedibacter sp.]